MDESKKQTAITNPILLARSRNLRAVSTPAEKMLWRCLRNRQLGGYKFRRQVVLGDYIVDFLCIDARLVVEIDGDTHSGRESYDARRENWLTSEGFTVIRFTNQDVRENYDPVLEAIREACDRGMGLKG